MFLCISLSLCRGNRPQFHAGNSRAERELSELGVGWRVGCRQTND